MEVPPWRWPQDRSPAHLIPATNKFPEHNPIATAGLVMIPKTVDLQRMFSSPEPDRGLAGRNGFRCKIRVPWSVSTVSMFPLWGPIDTFLSTRPRFGRQHRPLKFPPFGRTVRKGPKRLGPRN